MDIHNDKKISIQRGLYILFLFLAERAQRLAFSKCVEYDIRTWTRQKRVEREPRMVRAAIRWAGVDASLGTFQLSRAIL